MIQANIWQRISATKKPNDAKKMMSLAFFVFIPLYLIVTLTGVLSLGIFESVPEGGIVPAMIVKFMPVGLAAFIFRSASAQDLFEKALRKEERELALNKGAKAEGFIYT